MSNASQSHSTLPTLAECDERIADAQYVIDRPDDYHSEAVVEAHRDRARWQFNRRFAARVAELESECNSWRNVAREYETALADRSLL